MSEHTFSHMCSITSSIVSSYEQLDTAHTTIPNIEPKIDLSGHLLSRCLTGTGIHELPAGWLQHIFWPIVLDTDPHDNSQHRPSRVLHTRCTPHAMLEDETKYIGSKRYPLIFPLEIHNDPHPSCKYTIISPSVKYIMISLPSPPPPGGIYNGICTPYPQGNAASSIESLISH